MLSVGTSIVPPGPCPPPADTPDPSVIVTTPQVTASIHDFAGSLLLDALHPGNWSGDKGFVGYGMITPFKKPPGGELLDWQKEYNTQVNKIRWVIEQVIANFKTWRIMHTDYRRPIETFSETISAVVGLHFYKLA